MSFLLFPIVLSIFGTGISYWWRSWAWICTVMKAACCVLRSGKGCNRRSSIQHVSVSALTL